MIIRFVHLKILKFRKGTSWQMILKLFTLIVDVQLVRNVYQFTDIDELKVQSYFNVDDQKSMKSSLIYQIF